jgi:hypothetical protein
MTVRLVPGYAGTNISAHNAFAVRFPLNAHNAFAVRFPDEDLAIREALDQLKNFGIFSSIALGCGASFRLRRRQLAF